MVLKGKEKNGISLRMTVFNAKMKRLILPFLQWLVFGGAGAHHVGSQRVNSNRGCVTEVRLRDY